MSNAAFRRIATRETALECLSERAVGFEFRPVPILLNATGLRPHPASFAHEREIAELRGFGREPVEAARVFPRMGLAQFYHVSLAIAMCEAL